MANLIASAIFTRNTGQPATGLTLTDIDFYLTEQALATGVDTVIWDGTQNPTEEIDNIGAYSRIYASADFSQNAYYLRATYTGAVVLDTDDVMGATGAFRTISLPVGAVEFTYVVTDTVTLLPIQGVDVWFTTDIAGDNVIWRGTTDVFGTALDTQDNKPWLDPGTYFVWAQRVGYTFPLPDTEVVS